MRRKAVIDTNVLVSGLRSRRGNSFRLLERLGDGRWMPCISVPLALEYEDVLKREFMRPFIRSTDVDVFLDYFFSVAELVEVPFRFRPTLRDPDDDRILEVAIRTGATIVTFNIQDFAGCESFGVRVMPPVEFLMEIGAPR